MTGDPRIDQIRAVLDEYMRPDDLDALHAVRRRILAILDSAPPAPAQWQMEARDARANAEWQHTDGANP